VKGYQNGEQLEHMKYSDRLRELGLFSHDKGRIKEDLTAVFCCLIVGGREDSVKFFSKVTQWEDKR